MWNVGWNHAIIVISLGNEIDSIIVNWKFIDMNVDGFEER